MTLEELQAQSAQFWEDFAYQFWDFPLYIQRTIEEGMNNPVCQIILAMSLTYAGAITLCRLIRSLLNRY